MTTSWQDKIYSDARKWQKYCRVVQERFWCDLLYGRYVNMEFEQLQTIAEEFEIRLQNENCYVPIFLRLFTDNRKRHVRNPEQTISERDKMIRQQLLNQIPDTPPITINPRLCAAIRIMQPGETISNIEQVCSRFTEDCKQQLGLNMVCIIRGPMTVVELASSSNQLREFMESVQEQTRRVSAEDITRQIKDYLNANIHRRVSREELAALVHLNADHMVRLFRGQTGSSLTDYIAREKMEHACKQLAMTDSSIAEIASSLGYENLSYFSKRFRQCVGILPKEYRKLHQTD